MNGPEHYREAERLLAAVVGDDQSPCVDDSNRIVANTIAAAQVHATLALAAATALPAIHRYYSDEQDADRAWAGIA